MRIKMIVRLSALLVMLVVVVWLAHGMAESGRAIIIGAVGFSAGDLAGRIKRLGKKMRRASQLPGGEP